MKRMRPKSGTGMKNESDAEYTAGQYTKNALPSSERELRVVAQQPEVILAEGGDGVGRAAEGSDSAVGIAHSGSVVQVAVEPDPVELARPVEPDGDARDALGVRARLEEHACAG